ncbi:MAG: colanic acid biosynthesis glycosyltransferase WcaL [Dehalococcoidia bacterium]|nr:colanic acid biosynthesis glycosyltransferase WcaL [Dehalococcoidia bacterium]
MLKEKPVVACCLNRYLPLSQTFIYEGLKGVRAVRMIVLAGERENPALFPLPDVFFLPARRYTRGWFQYQIDRRLFRLLPHERLARRKRVRLLHAHFGGSGVLALPLKRRLDVPLITTFHGYDISRRSWLIEQEEAYQELFAEGDLFLVGGGYMRRRLVELGCPEEKIEIHHLGIDTQKFGFSYRRPGDNGKVVLLFVGRFTEKKGLPYALRAVSRVFPSHRNMEFRIVGDGELRPQIEDLIRELGIGECVTLLGAQPSSRVAEEMAQAHIFLGPSVTAADGDSEGTPITLMEAQSSGLPVVSTHHADIPEVVLDGESGFLVAEGDVEALAERISYLIANPQSWEAMGEAGRRHIEQNYNSYLSTRELEGIYFRWLE